MIKLKIWCNKKLKLWQHSKTQMWQNSKTHIVTKLKLWQIKMWRKTETWNVTKFKLWSNSRTQIMTELKNSNCDKTWKMTKLNFWRKNSKVSFRQNILTPWKPMRYSLGSVLLCISNLIQYSLFSLLSWQVYLWTDMCTAELLHQCHPKVWAPVLITLHMNHHDFKNAVWRGKAENRNLAVGPFPDC